MFKILLQGCRPSWQVIRNPGNQNFYTLCQKRTTMLKYSTFVEHPWLLFSISNCCGGRSVFGTLSFSEE